MNFDIPHSVSGLLAVSARKVRCGRAACKVQDGIAYIRPQGATGTPRVKQLAAFAIAQGQIHIGRQRPPAASYFFFIAVYSRTRRAFLTDIGSVHRNRCRMPPHACAGRNAALFHPLREAVFL